MLHETNCYVCVSYCFPEAILYADYSFNNYLYPSSSVSSSGSHTRPTMTWGPNQGFSAFAISPWKGQSCPFLREDQPNLCFLCYLRKSIMQVFYLGPWNLFL